VAPESTLSELGLRERKRIATRRAIQLAAVELASERGFDRVTIDEISHVANVSPRTFFNYFPSKAAAALGLPDLRIADEQRERFVAGTSGNVVHDLCDLLGAVVATAGDRLSDREAKHDLVMQRPELQPELQGWLARFRAEVLALASLRLPEAPARAAAAFVLAALMEAVQAGDAGRSDLGDRLWAGITEMCAVAGCSGATA